MDRLGLRALVTFNLDRLVDGEIGIAAARPDLQRAVDPWHARGLVIDDQDRRLLMTPVEKVGGGGLLRRPPDVHVQLEAVLLDLVEEASLESIRRNNNHSVDFPCLIQETEFRQYNQRLAQTLLKEKAHALLAFGKLERGDLNGIEGRHFSEASGS